MPTTLTDDASQFPASITAPLGGDPRTDVSIQTPLQQLANRTANMKGRLDVIAPASTNGAILLRHVPNDAALLAIGAADRVDRSLCLVDGIGLYQFLADNTTAALSPWVRQPNDVLGASPPAAGRWVLYPISVLGISFGIPQLDAAGRLPAPVVRNGIVAAGNGVGIPNFITTNATPTDVTGTAVTLQGLVPGDTVFVDYSATLSTDQVGHTTAAVATVTKPDNSKAAVSGSLQSIARIQPAPSDLATSTLLACAVGAFPVTMAGTHVFTLQISAVLGGSAFASNANLRAWAWRP